MLKLDWLFSLRVQFNDLYGQFTLVCPSLVQLIQSLNDLNKYNPTPAIAKRSTSLVADIFVKTSLWQQIRKIKPFSEKQEIFF